jgi:hypothetical protein
MKRLGFVLICGMLSACANTPKMENTKETVRDPAAYSYVKSGNFSMSSSNGMTVMQNGASTIIISTMGYQGSRDAFGGSWTDGMQSDIQRVLTSGALPARYRFWDYKAMTLKLSTGEDAWILAGNEEDMQEGTGANSAVQKRADAVCRLTGMWPYAEKFWTASSKGEYLYIDPLKITTSANGPQYEAEKGSKSNRITYFNGLSCAMSPANYTVK